MNEWVYPVNQDKTDSWGYDVGVLDLFGGPRAAGVHDWYLGNCFNLITAGDRIWAYAVAPLSRIVAVGIFLTDPRVSTGGEWRIDIRWDRRVTRILLADPPPASVLEIRTQTVRQMRDTESKRLTSFLNDAHSPAIEELPRGRQRHLREVTQRQGQRHFRQRLMVAYGGRCAISECDIDSALEAAHIEQYDGAATDVVTNGLLLRADLHNLFDAGLLWIDGVNKVRIAPKLRDGHYGEIDGKSLRVPAVRTDRPSKELLRWHRENVAWGIRE